MNMTFEAGPFSVEELARVEFEAEIGGRCDYLHEAFGAEADMLAAQDRDDALMAYGFFSEEGSRQASEEWTARYRARRALAAAHAEVEEEVPF
jgi:hypothetical protein